MSLELVNKYAVEEGQKDINKTTILYNHDQWSNACASSPLDQVLRLESGKRVVNARADCIA
jgi:hypothetical protein